MSVLIVPVMVGVIVGLAWGPGQGAAAGGLAVVMAVAGWVEASGWHRRRRAEAELRAVAAGRRLADEEAEARRLAARDRMAELRRRGSQGHN